MLKIREKTRKKLDLDNISKWETCVLAARSCITLLDTA